MKTKITLKIINGIYLSLIILGILTIFCSLHFINKLSKVPCYDGNSNVRNGITHHGCYNIFF